jgi:hypothetical protein
MEQDTEKLRAHIRALLDAIQAAKDIGCIDHIDCWDDSDEKFYKPIHEAKKALDLPT